MRAFHLALRSASLAIANALGGQGFAGHIRKFAPLLYPTPENGGTKNATRFHLRSVLYATPSRQWFELLESDPRLQSLVSARPHLAEKIHRPYLRSNYAPAARLATLDTHYRYCLTHPSGRLPLEARGERVELGRVSGKNDAVFQVFLGADEQFMKEGEFVIHLWNDDGRLYTLVAAIAPGDTGTGIPHEIIDRIFDPFFTTKGPDKGTGLGLSVAHGIIEDHGGRMELVPSSAGADVGACFRVVLPVEKSARGVPVSLEH